MAPVLFPLRRQEVRAQVECFKLAVASGKGGTGKTTIAVNLARHLEVIGKRVTVVDCDVEEPNSHFFLKPEMLCSWSENVQVPEITHETCLGESCRKCIELCRFKCLIWMADEVMVFPELCHSCGLCSLACPTKSVSETTRSIGKTDMGKAEGVNFYRGLLNIGEAMAPPLIRAVKKRAKPTEISIYDCPPGTSCPAVEAMGGASYVLLVAEPTPFGLHDLKLAVALLRTLDMKFGVVINRDGMGDTETSKWLEAEDIAVLGRVPYDRKAAEAYSGGGLLIDKIEGYSGVMAEIWNNIQKEAM